MYRRKIGKKIFRRTRKHKFYGIKVKKGPSMLTRKRIRRGGAADVHSVIGKYASRSLFLDRQKCQDLEQNAIDAQTLKKPGETITYTPNALGDKEFCKQQYRVDIDKTISEFNLQQAPEQGSEQQQQQGSEQQQQPQQQQQQPQQQQQQQQQQPQQQQQQQQQQPQPQQQPQQQQQQQQQELVRNEVSKAIGYLQREYPGLEGFNDNALTRMSVEYLKTRNKIYSIYTNIISILRIIFSDKDKMIITKIDRQNSGSRTVKGQEKTRFDIIMERFVGNSRPDNIVLIELYNSMNLTDDEKFGITRTTHSVMRKNPDTGEEEKVNKVDIKIRDPYFLNFEKVLLVLYSYYKIWLTNYAEYRIYLTALNSRIEKHDIIHKKKLSEGVNSIHLDILPEFLRPLILKYSSPILYPNIETPELIETLQQDDINMISERLLKPINLDPTVTVDHDNAASIHSLNLMVHGAGIKDLSNPEIYQNSSLYVKSIPLGSPLSIIDVPKFSKEFNLDYFEVIFNISIFLIKYAKIFCFTSFLGGKSTKTDIRKKIIDEIIESPTTASLIDNYVTSNHIFNEPLFDELHIPFKNRVIEILRENISKTRGCNSNFFSAYIDPSNSKDKKYQYFLCMFLNMIIYACYNISEDVNKKRWSRKGTDLMIIYMNFFILKYIHFILQQLTPIIDGFHNTYYDKLFETYIFYDKTLDSLVLTIRNILDYIKDTNLTKYRTFKSSTEYREVINSLNFDTLEKKYGEIKESIDQSNRALLDKIKFFEYFSKIVNTNSHYLDQFVEADLYSEIRKLGSKIIRRLESNASQQSLARVSSLPAPDIYIVTPDEYSANIDFSSMNKDKMKEKCKELLPVIIERSRRKAEGRDKPGENQPLNKEEISKLNICASPDDIFDKIGTWWSGDREYIKRIARAYYGIKEFLNYAGTVTKHNIAQLPNVQRLFSLVEANTPQGEKLRNAILHQCKTDILKEDKVFSLGITSIREQIRSELEDPEVEKICKDNILNVNDKVNDEFNSLLKEQGIEVDIKNALKRELDSEKDINRHKMLINRHKMLINDLSTFDPTSEQEMIHDMGQRIRNLGEQYDKLGFLDKLLVDTERFMEKLPAISSMRGVPTPSSTRSITAQSVNNSSINLQSIISSMGRGGSSKRRGITIKRVRYQQKQHKTRKHGRKYRASRPNKKTKKHLGRGRGRPHRRTRSH